MNSAGEKLYDPCRPGKPGAAVDCEHCLIRKKMLFAELDVKQASFQLETVVGTRFQRGEVIYRMGDEASALYSIGRGIVKLTLMSEQGEPRIVRLVGPGGVVGLEAQLAQGYEHTAECLSEVYACRIPALTMRQLLRDQPALCRSVLKQWHEHLQVADRLLLDLAVGAVETRVVDLLVMLDDMCLRSRLPLLLPGNRDIATLIGVRVESVSRVMARLKRDGALLRQENGNWLFTPERA